MMCGMCLGVLRPLTCVGVMVLTSSEARLFSKVVFPALSNPRSTILTSCSEDPFSFSMTESKPYVEGLSRRVGQCHPDHKLTSAFTTPSGLVDLLCVGIKKYHDRSFAIGYLNFLKFELTKALVNFRKIKDKKMAMDKGICMFSDKNIEKKNMIFFPFLRGAMLL